MKVTAKITFGDIFAATLRLLLFRKSTWWGGLGLFLFYILLNLSNPGVRVSLAHFVASFIFVSVVFLVIFAPAIFGFVPYFTARRYMNLPGNEGLHEFETSDRGFFERTSARESLTAWHAISKVIHTKRFVMIYLASWMFYVIPRNAFSDEASFDAFSEEIEARISAGSKS